MTWEGEPRTWDWRKTGSGWTFATDPSTERLFHAYDVNNLAACDPTKGCFGSVEPVNEGSRLCPACQVIVKAEPEGRPKRDFGGPS